MYTRAIFAIVALIAKFSLINGAALAQFPQVTFGKPIDCNSAQVKQKLLLPLRETMEKVIRDNTAMNGIPEGRILDVQVVSAALTYTGAPAYEGMLYQQCEVTGFALVQATNGRTGRIPIPNLPVSLGYDEQGILRVKTPSGKLF